MASEFLAAAAFDATTVVTINIGKHGFHRLSV